LARLARWQGWLRLARWPIGKVCEVGSLAFGKVGSLADWYGNWAIVNGQIKLT